MFGVIEQGAAWVPGWMRYIDSAPRGLRAVMEERLRKFRRRPSEYVGARCARRRIPRRTSAGSRAKAGEEIPRSRRLSARRRRPQSDPALRDVAKRGFRSRTPRVLSRQFREPDGTISGRARDRRIAMPRGTSKFAAAGFEVVYCCSDRCWSGRCSASIRPPRSASTQRRTYFRPRARAPNWFGYSATKRHTRPAAPPTISSRRAW